MLPSILCFATSRDHAGQIVESLQTDHVPSTNIAVLVQSLEDTHPELIKGLGQSGGPVGAEEKTEAGTAIGGMAGAAASVAVAGTLSATPLLAAAPLVVGIGAAIGAVASNAATESKSGLSSYGIAPSRLHYYEQKMQGGAHLVAVRTEDEAELERARNVFEQAGGQEVEIFRLTKKLT